MNKDMNEITQCGAWPPIKLAITIAVTEIPPVFFIPVSLLATPAWLQDLTLSPSPLPCLSQLFLRPHRDPRGICFCSPAPGLRVASEIWGHVEAAPALPQASVGRCFPASLPAQWALLLLSHCPPSTADAPTAALPSALTAVAVFAPESERTFLSPAPCCDGSPGPWIEIACASSLSRSLDKTVSFSLYLGPAPDKETPSCSPSSCLPSGLGSKLPLNQPPPSSFNQRRMQRPGLPVHVNACLPVGVLWPYTHSLLSFSLDIPPDHQKQNQPSLKMTLERSIIEEPNALTYCVLVFCCSLGRSSSAWRGYFHIPTDGPW